MKRLEDVAGHTVIISDCEHRARRERIATEVLAIMTTNLKQNETFEMAATRALQYADALIAELDKGVE